MRFKDKVVIVTGAGSGLGLATVQRLAAGGSGAGPCRPAPGLA